MIGYKSDGYSTNGTRKKANKHTGTLGSKASSIKARRAQETLGGTYGHGAWSMGTARRHKTNDWWLRIALAF